MGKKIQYEGFEPTPQLKSAVKQALAQIGEKAPSESSQVATITKRGDEYIGELRVASINGAFIAHSRGESADTVLEELRAKLDQDLTEWRKHRFSLA